MPSLISTHAPLAGRDCYSGGGCPHFFYFNPRAPCGARLVMSFPLIMMLLNFNPRAPCGARPNAHITIDKPLVNFNPRAPCGARQMLPQYEGAVKRFQPTRPLRGATSSKDNKIANFGFQPTRPLRGATKSSKTRSTQRKNFNPRAPCGARPFPSMG